MSKFTAVDLFSGMGGLSLGFQLDGRFDVVAGIDNYEPAVRTFYRNHPAACEAYARSTNVQYLTGKSLLSTLGLSSIDVVLGGPPCQGFSAAGRRDDNDERNQLVWEYVRLVDELKPKFFLMENVPRITLAKDNGVLFVDKLLEQFRLLGYQARLFAINAKDFGVPQVRKRVFIVGNRMGKTPVSMAE